MREHSLKLLLQNIPDQYVWRCELCVDGYCSDHKCRRGDHCQAELCCPQTFDREED